MGVEEIAKARTELAFVIGQDRQYRSGRRFGEGSTVRRADSSRRLRQLLARVESVKQRGRLYGDECRWFSGSWVGVLWLFVVVAG